jgi:hypothetical protein
VILARIIARHRAEANARNRTRRFLELGVLHVLRRSGVVHRSPVLLDDRR